MQTHATSAFRNFRIIYFFLCAKKLIKTPNFGNNLSLLTPFPTNLGIYTVLNTRVNCINRSEIEFISLVMRFRLHFCLRLALFQVSQLV